MKNLYDVSRELCHDLGFPWTDPRTGITHYPPEAVKRVKAVKRKAAKKTRRKKVNEKVR